MKIIQNNGSKVGEKFVTATAALLDADVQVPAYLLLPTDDGNMLVRYGVQGQGTAYSQSVILRS